MNDIAKQNISARLIKALRDERLTQLEASNCFDIRHEYISSACNPKTFFKCSNPGWETLRKWANSGEKIRAYKLKLLSTYPLPKKRGIPDKEYIPPPPPPKKYGKRIKGVVLEQIPEILKLGIEIDIKLTLNGQPIKL